MRRPSGKNLMVEGWAYLVIAVIAFAGGLLIGDLGSSPKTETVYVAAAETEEAAAETEEPAETGETTEASEPGAQVFAANGCGSCHTFEAANSTGTTGPNLNEFLAPDDNQAGIEVMIANPNSEVAEGFKPNVMPQTYGSSIPKPEIEQLAEFLVENSPAK